VNQPQIFNYFFNLFDVPVANGFAAEKKFNFTGYAQRKWRCGKTVD
jgi:hypothetical protein